MGWYSMQGTNVDPHNSDLFGWLPKEANSKSELVNLLIRAYDKTREEGNPVDDVEWVRYFTGWEANCGEIYLLSRSYANSIGYNGAFTFKNSDFMIVHGRNLDTTGFAPISKSKKLSKSGRFNVVNYQRKMPIDLDESEYNKVIGGEDSGEWFSNNINGKDFLGSAYYLPDENRLYHVYYDGKYDEEDVEQFGRLRHAFVYYDDEDDDYSASTKKSRMLSKSFNDMVKSVRKGEHLEKDVSHDFKVGDILVSSWGYDQTNVQWYQVVGVTPKSVKIREIKGRIVHAIGSMSGEAVPIPDAFTNNLWFGEQKTARINQFGKVNITSDGYITAHKWDGNPEYVSWYA